AQDNPNAAGMTLWNPFKDDTSYFAPSAAPFMVNFRVADLHALLAALREEGCEVQDKVDESEFGKFGWVMDPEGNKLELWEPPAGQYPAPPGSRQCAAKHAARPTRHGAMPPGSGWRHVRAHREVTRHLVPAEVEGPEHG